MGALFAIAMLAPAFGIHLEGPPTPDREPPTVIVPAEMRVRVGREAIVLVRVDNHGYGPAALFAPSLPDGATFDAETGLIRWQTDADDVGTHKIVVTAVSDRRFTRREIPVYVRYPINGQDYLAMGDSVASGHGLQRRDYLGLDSCWRDGGEAYPAKVQDGLGNGDMWMVACSGVTTAELFTAPVTGGPSDITGEGRMSQVDWAIRTNPGVITLSVGANDLRFDSPGDYASGDQFDVGLAVRRLDDFRIDLDAVLDRLVDATDADIIVTTLHNPTALNPHGIDGCEGPCFRQATTLVLDTMNAAIENLVANYPGRVAVADVVPVFAGHEAKNGRGPDGIRAGRGFFGSLLPLPTRGIQAFCAKGHPEVDTFINTVDCVHPNGEGTQAYADVVLEALATLQ